MANRPQRLLALLSLAVALAVWHAVPAAAAQRGGPPFVAIPGEMELSGVLVARPLQPADAARLGLSPAELAERTREAAELARAYEVLRYVGGTDEYLLRVPAGETEDELALRLLASGSFQYVEPDWTVHPVGGCSSDPQLGNQWHHAASRMQSCDAWQIHTGDPSVVVAICDTGVRVTHQDLLLNRREGFHVPSGTWESSGGAINDINGHGTRCTGCAAANGDNGVGVSGVGWNLGHRMMRVTDNSDGTASLSNLTLAARTAADAGDRVASVSYGGVTSSSVQTTGQYLRDRNALLVWAAGNSNTLLSGDRDDAVIVVGATDENDAKASFSSYGPFVDLFGPGVSIRSTTRNSNTSYGNASGTSFATPLVAGLIGMIWSVAPSLTPDQVETVLRLGCEDIGAPGVDEVFGWGRINSFRSLELAVPELLITYPEGRPDFVAPGGSTRLAVEVAPGTEQPLPGSGVLFVSSGGPFAQVPLVEEGAGIHAAYFPPASCGADVSWFVRFDLVGGGSASSPSQAPATTFQAQAYVVSPVLMDAFEAESGWTVGAPGDDATTGTWVRVDPIGTAAQPEDDHTPWGTQCFVTGQGTPNGSLGENDVDDGTTTLLSPVYDLSDLENPVISYWRWYSNNTGASPSTDVFVIDVSNDGGASWVNVEIVGPAGPGTSGGWLYHEFFLSELLPPTAAVKLRFVASDLGPGSIVEAAVDDLEIRDLACGCGPARHCVSTPNSTGIAGEIHASGSFVVSENALHLTAHYVPPDQLGIFYYGSQEVQFPFGNGFRCVGGSVFRLPVITIDGSGQAHFVPDLTQPPSPRGQVTAGSTWSYQFWFRDPAAGGAGFDLTDSIAVTFCR